MTRVNRFLIAMSLAMIAYGVLVTPLRAQEPTAKGSKLSD